MINKLIKGDGNRISRIHDCRGNIVPMKIIFTNLPRAIYSWVLFRIFGMALNRPWISYEATKKIEEKLKKKECDVLEFGSGASTVWFATRSRHLTSIENDKKWHEIVSQRLKKIHLNLLNVDYYFSNNRVEYSGFKSDSNSQFDIILIDGPYREECLIKHLQSIKPGGLIYIDNTDVETSCGEVGEMARALLELKTFAQERNAKITRFTDFAPSCLHATEGYLVELPE